MLLKKADDKSKRIALLNDLQQSTVLNPSQRKWLRDELMRCKKGIQGESEAAFYLDGAHKNAQNHVLLHDLRLVDDGEMAQIDHLLIGRGSMFYLIETKNFAGNLIINDQGEFTVDYGDCGGLISPDTSIGGIHLDEEHEQERTKDIQRGIQAASCADDSRTGTERGRRLPRHEARRDGCAAVDGAGR